MDDLKSNLKKTGTATVGIKCKEGIVLAADKRGVAGESYFIPLKGIRKIHLVADNIALTIAGIVSDAQMIIKMMRAELKLKTIDTRRLPTVKEAANLFASLMYQKIRSFSPIPPLVSFIIAGKNSDGTFELYEVGPDGSVSEFKNYVTTGAYGSIMGYGILENEWSENLTLEQARKLALKVIRTAIKRDASVGEGIDVLEISKEGLSEIKEEKVSD